MQKTEKTLLPETIQFEELLLQLTWLTKRHVTNQLNQFQITPAQFATLRCIAHNPNGVSMSNLSEHCQSVMPTMTGIINRLVSRGLVERKRDPSDRRSTLIQLTDQGKAVLQKITEHRRVHLDRFLTSLNDQERADTMLLLNRYLKNMESWLTIQEEA